MLRLRKILLYNYPYYILLIIVIIFSFFRINSKYISNYSTSDKIFVGIITNIKIEGDLLSFTLKDKNKEIVNASYYFKTLKEKNKYIKYFKLGDKLKLIGEFSKIDKPTTKNTFNYYEYSKRKRHFYNISITSIIKIRNNKSILYFLKNNIYKYFDTFKSGAYLKLILLGDKSTISKKTLDSFRENGISHLFAISGMHVGVLSSIILKVLKKLKISEEKRYIITALILFLYTILVGCLPSILRASLFFFYLTINKIYYLHIETINIFILTFISTIIIDPFYIYDIGFQYSFLISLTLILSSNILNKYKSYFISLLYTSIISFVISIPITLYNFYQINLMSILYNLFYVPFVTYLLFPLSLLILIIKPLSFIYDILINILVTTSTYLANINTLKMIFGHIPIIFYLIYLLLFLVFIKYHKKVLLIIYLLILMLHYNYYNIFDTDYLVMLDIGQGDSFILHSKGETILIDTGGIPSYHTEKWKKKTKNSIALNITLPYLKSRGIRRLNKIILTHFDYDHLGEALNIIENYKVDNILINEGEKNYLEKLIIKKFKNINICYQDTYFKVGNFKFYSLNKDLKDENSSSIVLFITYNNYKMLFMGDANFKSEDYIIKNYELEEIDILKLGHHGSKTSSKESFLQKVKPKIALISAGKNNKFNHPNIETLKRLEKYKIKYYSTKDVGTVEFNFTNNKIIATK